MPPITTNAFFLYVRDPDGNRFELFTGDDLVADPDWPTVKWDWNDPRRATFWGGGARAAGGADAAGPTGSTEPLTSDPARGGGLFRA